MRKILSTLLALAMLLSCAAFAEEAAPVVYVSVSDDAGMLVLAHAPVTVTDADADHILRVQMIGEVAIVCIQTICHARCCVPDGQLDLCAVCHEQGAVLRVLT